MSQILNRLFNRDTRVMHDQTPTKKEQLPRHIAVIMDGNGRWAQSRGLPRIAGHKRGVDVVKSVTRAAGEIGIDYLTLYTFSTENWKRSNDEVSGLMALVEEVVVREIDDLVSNGVRLKTMGRSSGLPTSVASALAAAEVRTATNTGLTLTLALNYGGRAELVDAVRSIAIDVSTGVISPDAIDESLVASRLYLPDVPDPDLLIRTGGDMRVSNFLLWQIAYSEIWVTDKYWPDFTVGDLSQAIDAYSNRDRRFGGVK